MSEALRLAAVTKTYRRGVDGAGGATISALDAVDLVVGEGEAVGVVGPNGAGKSTLLRLVAGISVPSAGTITRTGRTVAIIELGLGLHPDLSGEENLAFIGMLLGLDRRQVDDRRDHIVAFAGLEEHMARPVKQYSTGMVARLSFAIAVHCDAEVLLLDEVISVGDVRFRQRAVERLVELNRLGTTMVVVSHDLAMVERLCPRTVQLDNGRVVDDGPTDAVLARYRGEERAGGPPAAVRLTTSGEATIAAGAPLGLHCRLELLEPMRSASLRLELLRPVNPLDDSPEGNFAVGATTFGLGALDAGRHDYDLVLDTAFYPAVPFRVRAVLTGGAEPVTSTCEARIIGPDDATFRLVVDGRWTTEAVG